MKGLFRLGMAVLFCFAGSIGAEAGEKMIRELVSEGNALYLEGKFESSLEKYQEAMRLEPDDLTRARIYYNLGNAYYRLGKFTEALEAYQGSLRLDPEDEDTKHNLEVVLRALAGEGGLLIDIPSEVAGGGAETDPVIQQILQKLEQTSSKPPAGPPQPPQPPPPPQKTPKQYRKDW